MRMAVLVCAAIAVMVAAACSDTDAPVAPACPDGTDPWVKYELYMGRGNHESGLIVADAAWEGFLGDTVTPRFPDGLTVLDGRGQWRGAEGLVQKERSKVLVILAPPGGDEMRLIDEVYKGRFAQEVRAPGRVRRVRVVFLTGGRPIRRRLPWRGPGALLTLAGPTRPSIRADEASALLGVNGLCGTRACPFR